MEEKQSVFKTALNAGLIFGLVLIVFNFVLFVTDLSITASGLTWISYLILAIGIVYAHNQYKKNGDSFMAYGTGLGIGTLVSLFSGILVAIFSAIYVSIIDTSYQQRALEQARMQLEKNGMNDQQIDQAMEMSEMFTGTVPLVIMTILGMAFIGFIMSLIISAFTKKSDPSAEI